MTSNSSPTFRIVKRASPGDVDWANLLDANEQPGLFSVGKRNLIVFLEMTGISAEKFLEILNKLSPNVVIDIRQAPKFDMGFLNRNITFQLFEDKNIFYFEAESLFNVEDLNSSQSSFLIFSKHFEKLKMEKRTNGPIIFLMREISEGIPFIRYMPRILQKFNKKKWDAYILPSGHG
jgi:hypothetical protein